MKGTPNQVKGAAYQPAAQSKPPRGMPGIGLAVPQLPAPKPAAMPPARAGGMTGDLMAQAAKKKMQGPAYPDPDHAPKPQAMGGAGVPSLGLAPQQQAQPSQQLDPLKQAAAQKMAGSAWNGTAPQPGGGKVSFAGQQQTQQPQQYEPKASGGGPGLPPLEQIGGAGGPGVGGLPGQGGNPGSYGTGTNPNPVNLGQNPNIDGGKFGGSDVPQGQVGAGLGPQGLSDMPGSLEVIKQQQEQAPGPAQNPNPGYTKDPYPGATQPGGLTPNGTPDQTWQDDWQKAEADKAANAWKGGDGADWFEQYMKGSIQGDKFGPGDEWVKQQGDSIALDAEKQAAADKMKSQSMYGAAGLGGSGMAVGGMGQIDSAKNAAVTSAKADLAGQQAKLGIQDKIAQLGTQMALAKQKGDVALQEKLANDLLKFQQQSQLLDMVENAPERLMGYLGSDSFFSSENHGAFQTALAAAYKSGDAGQVLAILTGVGKAQDATGNWVTYYKDPNDPPPPGWPGNEGNWYMADPKTKAYLKKQYGGGQPAQPAPSAAPEWYKGTKPWDQLTPEEQFQAYADSLKAGG